MTFSFRPAARSQAKPLIGIYAESGAGKTFSALLLARGFVGPDGRIGMIETESGRGEAYADPSEYPELRGPDPLANYEVLSLREDFSPKAYGEAISAAEHARFDALIIDSGSHEWEGTNGVLAMAAANGAAGKKGVLMWQEPKIQHKRHFMLRFMQTPIPLVILCMRAKYPMKEVPKPGGGKEWVRCAELEPTQADDILFEMFVHGWISQGDHRFHMTKCTAKSLDPVFGGNRPLSLDTGRQLSDWARGAAPARMAPAAADPFAEASAAAAKGSKSFTEWWNGPGKDMLPTGKSKRFMVNHRKDELKAIAARVDRGESVAEDVGDEPAPDDDTGATFARLLTDIAACETREEIDALSERHRNLIHALPDQMRAEWARVVEAATAQMGKAA